MSSKSHSFVPKLGAHILHLVLILSSTFNTIGGVYVKRKRVSTLTSYNFCISNLILNPELIISVIHNCYLDVTIFSPIQRPKSDVKLEVPCNRATNVITSRASLVA